MENANRTGTAGQSAHWVISELQGHIEIIRQKRRDLAIMHEFGSRMFFSATELGSSYRFDMVRGMRDGMHKDIDSSIKALADLGFDGDGNPLPAGNPVAAPQPANDSAPEPAIILTGKGERAAERAAKRSKTAKSKRGRAAARARWDNVKKSTRKATKAKPVKKAAAKRKR